MEGSQRMSSNLRLVQTKRTSKYQSIRPRPEGPDKVICVVIEKATGRSITSASGDKTRKRSASGIAKKNAILKLKKKYSLKYDPKLHEFVYKYGG